MPSQWDPALPSRAAAAWKSRTDAEKQAALVQATAWIDQLPFKGQRLRSSQTLAWPRSGVFRDDGSPVSGVPPEVKEATSMVAGFILADVPYDVPAIAWVFHVLGHLIEEGVDLADREITWH